MTSETRNATQPKPPRTLTAYALACAARGWFVFPIRPHLKKPPAIRDWENRATTDPDQIRRWWQQTPYNVGIACGPSHLVVIDCDVPKPGQHPPPRWADQPGIGDGADVLAALCELAGELFPADTFTVRTARGGMHLFFTTPNGFQLRNTNSQHATALGWLIDTRAGGGYIVAPGSTITLPPGTPGTGRYDVANPDPAQPLPQWLSARLSTPPDIPAPGVHPQPAGKVSDPTAFVRAALQGEGQRVRTARPGGRNHALNKAAYNLGRLAGAGALTQDQATAALYTAVAAHIGTGPDAMTPREAHDTITSGLTSGTRNPRQLTPPPTHTPAAPPRPVAGTLRR